MAAVRGRRRTTNFFKVLIPGFHQRLNLPPAVSKEFEEAHTSRTATLRSRIGAWEITLSKNSENNLISFDEGWSEFVESHALHVGDFLVFEHTRSLHFDVLVFGPSACEKLFDVEPKTIKTTRKKKKKEASEEEALNFTTPIKRRIKEDDGSPYFVKKMIPSYAKRNARVNIPTKFMRRNDLGQLARVGLRDAKNGREWSVALCAEANRGYRNRMCGVGWYNFYNSNQIKTGDTCVFTLRRRFTTPDTIFFDVQINSN